MARHYYLTRAGRLRRKDNTLCFEPTAAAEDAAQADDGASILAGEQQPAGDLPAREIGTAGTDDMGDLAFEPAGAGELSETM